MAPILFDGWPLVFSPANPAGLHLLALLERLSPEAQAILALPGAEPAWLEALLGDLPNRPAVQPRTPPVKNNAWGRLAWEQRVLPEAARHSGAGTIHTSGGAPLLVQSQRLLSPTEFPERDRPGGLAARLRLAMGQGGASQATVAWPADLPEPPGALVCPPFASRQFSTHHSGNRLQSLDGADVALPDQYVLYHGPGNEAALHRLLASWTWAAGPVGAVYPLVAAGLDGAGRSRIEQLALDYKVSSSVLSLPDLRPDSMAVLYQRCTVLFHPVQPAPWGDPLLNALASGKPIVSADSPQADRRLGPAAYLVTPGDSRALGAALLSVLVEESVSEHLSAEAVRRSLAWEAVEITAEGYFRRTTR